MSKSAGISRGRSTAEAVGRWLAALVVLAAVAICTVGVIGAETAKRLDDSADSLAATQSAVIVFEQAEMYRSEVEAAMVRTAAAAGTPKAQAEATEAAVHLRDMTDTLGHTRNQLVRAGSDPPVLSAFDDLAAVSTTFAEKLTAVAAMEAHGDVGQITSELPALADAAGRLDGSLTRFGVAIRAHADRTAGSVTGAARAGMWRILWFTSAGLLLLAAVGILIHRRQRRLLDDKADAEARAGASTAELELRIIRQELASHLHDALQMADDDDSVFQVVAAAGNCLVPGHGVGLLLADASDAHLRRVTTTGLDSGGCPVSSPRKCPAIRQGQTRVFPDSTALEACPYLGGAGGKPCSAVCLPLNMDGHGLGVLHIRGAPGEPPAPSVVEQVVDAAGQVASRLATVWAYQRAQLQAATDGLTGMLNRRSVEDQLRGLIARDAPLSVAMLDLDHFKNINDAQGHDTGDRALRAFARVVRENIRAGDLAARQGGDEFIIVFPDAALDMAAEVVERIRHAIGTANQTSELPPFTASAGLAVWHPGMTMSDVLLRADARLLRAKAAGRDRMVTTDEPLAVMAASGTPTVIPSTPRSGRS